MKRLIGLNILTALAASIAVLGASVAVNEDLSIYGEISGISAEASNGDDEINWGGKLGAKFVF